MKTLNYLIFIGLTVVLRKKPTNYLSFRKYSDVFLQNDNDIGCTNTIQHYIRLTDDKPISQLYCRIFPSQYEKVKLHIRKQLDTGVVRGSTSPLASPIVLVRKKENSL
jgi:hypothetical protein